jgi:hypothetical protein
MPLQAVGLQAFVFQAANLRLAGCVCPRISTERYSLTGIEHFADYHFLFSQRLT